MNQAWVIAPAIFLLVQTGGLIWWAASITTTVKFMAQKIDRMTDQLDAMASKEAIEVIHRRIDKQDQRIRELEAA